MKKSFKEIVVFMEGLQGFSFLFGRNLSEINAGPQFTAAFSVRLLIPAAAPPCGRILRKKTEFQRLISGLTT